MLGASIGKQFLTNDANNKHAIEQAEKQRQFRDLLDRRKLEHSYELQVELNHIQSEMELAVHELRMKEIYDTPDFIIAKLVQQGNVDSWPLKILPFVIKGQSIGTLIGGGSQTISVHCFLTPSNNPSFNKLVYPDLDIRLQSEINNNWSVRTSHPIYYYGGSWKDKNADINHIATCIQQIESNIKSIPCIVITPKFMKEGVKFCVRIWGMGEDGHHDYEFIFNNLNEPDPFSTVRFSYNYSINNTFDQNDFINATRNVDVARKEADEFIDTTIYEFSTYVQVLIGYITDRYFWNIYGLRPVLPSLIANKSISVDGLKWIAEDIKRLYLKTIKDSFAIVQTDNAIADPHRLSEWYAASLLFWEDPNELKSVSQVVDDYCSRQPADSRLIEMHSFSISAINELIINNYSNTGLSIWDAISYYYWAKSGGQKVQGYDEMNVNYFSYSDIEALVEAIRIAKPYMHEDAFHGILSIIRRKIES